MNELLIFGAGLVVGAIVGVAALALVGARAARDQDAEVKRATVDAVVYGLGMIRRRPDGYLERVQPGHYDLVPREIERPRTES